MREGTVSSSVTWRHSPYPQLTPLATPRGIAARHGDPVRVRASAVPAVVRIRCSRSGTAAKRERAAWCYARFTAPDGPTACIARPTAWCHARLASPDSRGAANIQPEPRTPRTAGASCFTERGSTVTCPLPQRLSKLWLNSPRPLQVVAWWQRQRTGLCQLLKRVPGCDCALPPAAACKSAAGDSSHSPWPVSARACAAREGERCAASGPAAVRVRAAGAVGVVAV